MKTLFKVTLFIFCLQLNAQEQKKDTIERETIWQMMKYDGATAFGGFKHAFTRPLHWKGDDFLTLGGVALGTYLMYSFDEESYKYFKEQGESAPQFLKEFGWYFGAPQNSYMLTAGIYGVGLLTRNEKIRHTGVLLVTSATVAGLIQTVSKTAFGRARPSTLEGRGSFKPFSSEGAYHSFPSGHTILSFTTAHAIARQFDSWFVKVPIYAVGMISPVSRLWKGAHWLTDVALGMAISVIVVDSVDNYLKDNNKYSIRKKRKISWKLNVGTNRVGLVGTF